MKNDISFPDWLKDFVGSDDAVGVFADWLFSSRAKNRASALVKINKINSIQAWLVESKAPKHIKACFVSAWRAYQQWLGEDKLCGLPVMDTITGHSFPTTLRVKRHFKNTIHGEDVDEEDEEFLDIRRFVSPPATVSVEAGITVGLGDFESARITVGVSVPCYTEELNNVYFQAAEWSTSRVEHEVDKIKGKRKPKERSSMELMDENQLMASTEEDEENKDTDE